MTEHTPGPWRVDATVNMSSFAVKPNKPTEAVGVVCACRWRHRRTAHVAEARANARLIASAPDLLAALEGMIDAQVAGYCEYCERHAPKHDDGTLAGDVPHRESCPVPQARAAIRKARGTKGA